MKKIFMSMAIVAAICFSVSAIDVYNHSFKTPAHPGASFLNFPSQTVTGGWWYVNQAGLTTNGAGSLMSGAPVDFDGQAGYIGWINLGNTDIRQDIPGPTIAGNGNTCAEYSTTEFTSGTTYTITYSYKSHVAANTVSNRLMIKNRDTGMGTFNETILDDYTDLLDFNVWFRSKSADFTAISRKNRIIFKGLAVSFSDAILIDNVTIEETSEKNFGFEVGSFHGWTDTGQCWNGAPINYNGNVAIGGWDGTYYACSRACRVETTTGTLQSKNFTLPAGGYLEFLAGGYSAASVGDGGTDYNYVILCDADTDAELARVYMPGTTGTMVTRTINPPSAYQGTGSEVYIKVVDDSAGGGWSWMTFDKLEIKIDPNRAWTAGAGNWNNAANWSGGIANGADDIAHLTNSTSGDITLDVDVTIAELNVDIAHNITGNGSLTLLGTVDVDTSISEEISTTLIASNGLAKAGLGTLAITTATDNYLGGDIDIDAGTLTLAAALTGANNQLNIDGGSTLNVASTVSIETWGQLRVGFFGAGTSTANINNGGILKCYTVRMGQQTAGTPIVNIDTGGEIVCANIDLEGVTPTGGKINIDGGTLSDSDATFTSTNWIKNMAGVTIEIMNGGATFNVDNQYREINHVITGTASGNLTKEGSKTLAFEVAPTFDGDIIVNNGKVLFNCDVSGIAGSVTVASGAEVGGSGTLPAMTVPSGATISPGNSIGTLSTSGNLTLDTGSAYDWEVALNNADLLSVGGTLVIGGAMTVNVIDAGSPNGTDLTLASATTISGDADDITMSYGPGVGGPNHPTDDGSGNLTATIIPEPGIIGLLSLLGLAILRRK